MAKPTTRSMAGHTQQEPIPANAPQNPTTQQKGDFAASFLAASITEQNKRATEMQQRSVLHDALARAKKGQSPHFTEIDRSDPATTALRKHALELLRAELRRQLDDAADFITQYYLRGRMP